MLNFLKKMENLMVMEAVQCSDDDIVAPADAELILLEEVNDDVFAQKILGDGVAFRFKGDKVILCAPANGKLSVLFDTGHMFGITMKNGVELMVHVGIDTVKAGGKGFKIMNKRQGDAVEAGDAILTVNLRELEKKYDLSTMLIVTNTNGKELKFAGPGKYKRGQSLLAP